MFLPVLLAKRSRKTILPRNQTHASRSKHDAAVKKGQDQKRTQSNSVTAEAIVTLFRKGPNDFKHKDVPKGNKLDDDGNIMYRADGKTPLSNGYSYRTVPSFVQSSHLEVRENGEHTAMHLLLLLFLHTLTSFLLSTAC